VTGARKLAQHANERLIAFPRYTRLRLCASRGRDTDVEGQA